MKNFFSNIIEKVKNFVENLTPAAKLKYIVMSGLTVAVVTSFLVVVALNTGKSETATNPEDFGTRETVSLNFDSELIFDIGGESSSVSTTDDITDYTSTTTDVASGTHEPTSGEESSSGGTDKNTETTDDVETQPTDPSQDYNPDPQPEDTTNTPVVNLEPTETTTQTQTTPKPTETTTKAHQTEPKPTETTKTPQTQPKPTETTTTVPQTTAKPTETTKPQENPPQPTGQFSLKEKKYDYNGANVSIVQVENKSQQAYTITITGKFKDANGKTIKIASKTFEGFPKGWNNYFVFQPGVKYSNASWEVKADEFTEKTYAEYFHAGTKVDTFVNAGLSDGSGRYIIPTSAEEVYKYKHYATVYGTFTPVFSTHSNPINYTSDLVVFDSTGKILCIETGGSSNFSSPENSPNGQNLVIFVSNVLWENASDYKIPDNLKNLTGIMAVKSVTEY